MKNQTKKIFRACLVATLLLTGFALMGAIEARAQTGIICSPPSNCETMYMFNVWDLKFSTGRAARFKKGETLESNEFYAIVLDSTAIGFSESDTCNDFSEAKRLAAQKLFPKNKVFASHYCDLRNVIIYTGYGDWHERDLLAVFLGEVVDDKDDFRYVSPASMQALLKTARKKYPKAEIIKMREVIDYTRR